MEASVDRSCRVALLLAEDRAEEAAQTVDGAYLPPADAESGALISMQISLIRPEVELARHHAEAAQKLASEVYTQVTGSSQRQYLMPYEARAALDSGKAPHLQGGHTQAAAMLSDAVALHAKLYTPAPSPIYPDALIALADCLINLHRLDEARVLEAQARAIHAANKDLGPLFRRPLAALQARLTDRRGRSGAGWQP